MIDIENEVFDRIATVYSAQYPDGSRYGEETVSPASFPCLTLVETDNRTYEGSLDAQMTEHDAWVTYEINIYSNKISGAKQECKDIMELVDTEMLAMGFVRQFCNQTRNANNRIYRMTARYRAVVSEDYRIYRQ